MPDKEEKNAADPGDNHGDKGIQNTGNPPLPEASLPVLVSSLASQVIISLGEMANPLTGERGTNIEQAKYSIDLIEVIRDKTKGNLTGEETKLIDGILFDLRMRFVRVAGG